MIRLAHPEYLWVLGLVPVLVALAWLAARRARNLSGRFAHPSAVTRLAPEAGRYKSAVKGTLAIAAIGLVIAGLANPQIGTRMEEVKQEGIDLMIALDVSNSMKAEDIKPNRLEKAKLEIRNLIGRLAGDRVGLIIFAGEAFTQFPLTTDYAAASLFLDALDVDAVSTQGTSLGAAITQALSSFDFEEPSTKVLVLITDGEDNEGQGLAAAEEAAAKGVLLYAIGMGSPGGAPIPVLGPGGQQADFKRDRGGQVVISRLDETGLERIAERGKGRYFRATNTQDELDAIYSDINVLEKRELGVKKFVDYEDRFQFFIAAALLLLILETLIAERRSALVARWNILKRKEAEA